MTLRSRRLSWRSCITGRSIRPANPNRRHADAFIAPFPLLPLGKAEAMTYGRIRADLARRGQLIGPNDLLIAVIALTLAATMVTHNTREFSRVPDLLVEDWES